MTEMEVAERYREKRRNIEKVFATITAAPPSERIHRSPSGLYRLATAAYYTVPPVSRGVVTREDDGTLIADVRRNYGHFWHAWVAHPNGCEYLLCGEDYQGYTVINLTRREQQVHFPREALSGGGFCWVTVYPSPDNLVLAVDGCIWGGPYHIMFFDFRQPDRLPLPSRATDNIVIESKGWIDSDTFAIVEELEVRASDGALFSKLPKAERDRLDTDSDLISYPQVPCLLKRPDFDCPPT